MNIFNNFITFDIMYTMCEKSVSSP